MPDRRAVHHEFMEKCLRFSVLIFNHFGEPEAVDENTDAILLDLKPADWEAAYHEAFGVTASFIQAQELSAGLIYAIQQYGPTSCAVWSFAHYTEHTFEGHDETAH